MDRIEMRKHLHDSLGSGRKVRCPVCDQNCRVYRRKLNTGMAAYLIDFVKEFEHLREWVSVVDLKVYQSSYQRGDYAYLRHWKLIEAKPNRDDPTRKDLGMWRPTPAGIDFANRRISVPQYVYLYNNRLLRHGGDHIDIIKALGSPFDYEELMEVTHVGPGSIFEQIGQAKG